MTSVSNLATVMEYQGQYDTAETMNQRALVGREKVLGLEHPDTLTSVNNLAVVLSYGGKYEMMEAMARRVLEGSEKALGLEHPGASFYAAWHQQPGLGFGGSGQVRGGGGDEPTCSRREGEGAGSGASFYANKCQQAGFSTAEAGQVQSGGGDEPTSAGGE